MKKIIAFLFLLMAGQWLHAQEAKKKKLSIPGSFVFEIGVNSPSNEPTNFSTNLFGSRTCNLMYQYEWVPLKKFIPQFSIVPGVSFSMEHFSLSGGYTLDYSGNRVEMSQRQLRINKSKFITNYLELPVELRFTANPSDPNRSFKFGVGFRVGTLLNASTKIDFTDNSGNSYKEKRRSDWNLNSFRAGLFAKVGVGSVSLFTYYNLTPMFQTNLGPGSTKMSNVTIGLSLNGF